MVAIVIAAVVGGGIVTPLPPGEGPEARPPRTEEDLAAWLKNMVWHHHFTTEEIQRATGLTPAQIVEAQTRLDITADNIPDSIHNGTLRMMPYPGGRHPRIGFLEGAIRPQRESKISVFPPWENSGYIVVDMPEALWSNLGLTYLAHTHIDTVWTKEGIELPQLEWIQNEGSSLELTRTLPNGIRYEAKATLVDEHLEMELKLTNGTDQPLTDLRVQNCIMLKGAPEFASLTNDNKQFEKPFAAVRSATHPDRWIITAWEPCHRPWGNTKVPCLHSDPRFPYCRPGETQVVRGWLSFFEGDDVEKEFARIQTQFFNN